MDFCKGLLSARLKNVQYLVLKKFKVLVLRKSASHFMSVRDDRGVNLDLRWI